MAGRLQGSYVVVNTAAFESLLERLSHIDLIFVILSSRHGSWQGLHNVKLSAVIVRVGT